MKQFFITIAGVFGGLVLFFIGVPILLLVLVAGSAKPTPPPAKSVLSLDLRQTLADQEVANPFAFLGGKSLSVMSVIETLHRAEKDDRVKGLLIRLPEGGMAPATADELRLAVRAFRATGKPVLAHSQGIYASGITPATYMLGAATGDFWMQPGAALQVTGVASEETFLKRAFDKYGIKADYQQRYEYKNAVNPYLYSDFTPAHRESEIGWMTSVYESELAAAAADRRLVPTSLRSVLEAGPYGAEDALARHLIDKVGQVSEAQAAIRAETDNAELVDFASYKASTSTAPAPSSSSAIAVIGAEGDIVTGTSGNESLTASGSGVYSDDIAKAFQDAIKDETVKAIVFRVSSPGGSDTASEQILAGVRAAKAAGKPVVVSMGTYAASGGYWISSEASKIVAEPTTLTGSIGVFGGKFAFGDALARFGVDMKPIGVGGDFAGSFGSAQPFSPTQRAAISAWMDHIYNGFVARVAEGRHLPEARVREIAKGRVWTGEQAKQLGLVDSLGGFYDAVREAKQLVGIPVNQPVRLKSLPARTSPFAAFQKAMGVSSASIRMVAASAWLLGDPRAQGIMDEAMRARLGVSGTTVLAPTPVH